MLYYYSVPLFFYIIGLRELCEINQQSIAYYSSIYFSTNR